MAVRHAKLACEARLAGRVDSVSHCEILRFLIQMLKELHWLTRKRPGAKPNLWYDFFVVVFVCAWRFVFSCFFGRFCNILCSISEEKVSYSM